jgi:WD40 repeat protein
VASNEYHIHVWDLTKALQNSSKDVSKISNETEEANGKSVNEQLKNDDVTENSSNTDGVTEQSSNTDDVTPESVKVLTPVHSQPTFVLSGHIQRVIFVTWSPHEDGRLLSVSYDNTAQVHSFYLFV